jgi:hypothetical protein
MTWLMALDFVCTEEKGMAVNDLLKSTHSKTHMNLKLTATCFTVCRNTFFHEGYSESELTIRVRTFSAVTVRFLFMIKYIIRLRSSVISLVVGSIS